VHHTDHEGDGGIPLCKRLVSKKVGVHNVGRKKQGRRERKENYLEGKERKVVEAHRIGHDVRNGKIREGIPAVEEAKKGKRARPMELLAP